MQYRKKLLWNPSFERFKLMQHFLFAVHPVHEELWKREQMESVGNLEIYILNAQHHIQWKGHHFYGIDMHVVDEKLPEYLEAPIYLVTSRTVDEHVRKEHKDNIPSVLYIASGDAVIRNHCLYVNGKTIHVQEDLKPECATYKTTALTKITSKRVGTFKGTTRALLTTDTSLERTTAKVWYWC